MLQKLISSNRRELINRCKAKALKRTVHPEVPVTMEHGVPLFLSHLVNTLRREHRESGIDASESIQEPVPAPAETESEAALHGAELFRIGYSVNQLVHDYGDVCQSVTELAVEQKAVISADEFRILNRCLDDAIADAVTSFGNAREDLIISQAENLNTSLDIFSDKHRRLVNIASQAYSAIRSGNVGLAGATSALLSHALEELLSLTDRKLPEIRQESTTTLSTHSGSEMKVT